MLCTFPTLNTFVVAYFLDVHFAMMYAGIAVVAFILVNLDTNHGYPVEKGIEGAKGANEPTKTSEDKYSSNYEQN